MKRINHLCSARCVMNTAKCKDNGCFRSRKIWYDLKIMEESLPQKKLHYVDSNQWNTHEYHFIMFENEAIFLYSCL